jgi:predicted nucleotidyltransferase component of viral defense system
MELPKNVAASVKRRLLDLGRAEGTAAEFMLVRYALERFLFRLSRSQWSDRFVLKGAMLLYVWFQEIHRPTRDADLAGFGPQSAEEWGAIVESICRQSVPDDGMNYLPESIRLTTIREPEEYNGYRVRLIGLLGKARIPVQVDIGLGDVVTPKTELIDFPTLLDQPAPRLRAYRPETAIAEKLQTLVVLDMVNSRMKDFFDLHLMAQERTFLGHSLVSAVRDTFERRRTPVPEEPPAALTAIFADDPDKRRRWNAFLGKNRLSERTPALDTVVERLAVFLLPVLAVAGGEQRALGIWLPGGPWSGAASDAGE